MILIKNFKEQELSQSDQIAILNAQKEILDLKISLLSTEDEEEKTSLKNNIADITDRINSIKGL